MTLNFSRRRLLTVAASMPVIAAIRPGLAAPSMTVYRKPTCGCCLKWVASMRSAGLGASLVNVDQSELNEIKASNGITSGLESCHTALVDDYVIEGHVPAADILRLLAERPAARGLAVPGMPIGSPGMEVGDRREPFDTLLVQADGQSSVFAEHHRR